MRKIYKLLSFWWPVKAASKREAFSFLRQRMRVKAQKEFNKKLKKVLKP